MIVRPKEETPKLGRKNIEAKTDKEAIAIYRKRFAPLADDIDLIVEGSENDGDTGRTANSVVERNGGIDESSTSRTSGLRNSADE